VYYIKADQLTGGLLQVSTEPMPQNTGEIIKLRQGDIPDLAKYFWHSGSLSFIEFAVNRYVSHTNFVKRLSTEELRAIYTLADSNIDVKIWLDKFKMAQEVWLDHPDLVNGINSFAQAGMFSAERAQEILS
jgi:hypothetical protein